MSSEPTLEGTGAIEGTLAAEQLTFDSHGALEHERCATPSCARGIATVAESIVRASTMGAVEGAGEHTVMANLYPSTGAEGAPVPAPSEAIAALAANTPCKWQTGPDRGPRTDAGGRASDTCADRRNGPPAAPSAMGHSARHSLTG